MIEASLDLTKLLRYVRYLRMSSEMQNPRSPQQQADTIDRTIQQRGYSHWVHVADFRDEAISGRYITKRPAFSQMLDQIRTGMLTVDLILVDTLERFGRVDDLARIRDELRKRCGVLILTADTGFADPTSIMGRVYGTMEAARTTAANQQKAHDVLRGKIDVAMLKHWPGGPPPRGYKLEARTQTRTTRSGKSIEAVHHVLAPDPSQTEVVVRVFHLADQTGWGCTRIANTLNNDSQFTGRFGRISASAVGYILNNPVYKGDYIFNLVATDVVDDRRVIQRKPEAEWIRIEGFCPAIVSREIWDRVNAAMAARGEHLPRLRATQANVATKQLRPLAPGISLVFPLTGLVRCAVCGGAMCPTRSGAKSKTAASYYYYRCPAAADGRCSNRLYVRGPWLWQVLVARLREVLFALPAGAAEGSVPAWLPELAGAVRAELMTRLEQDSGQGPVLEQEAAAIHQSVTG